MLVLRYTFGASNADRIDLWVNPQINQPLGPPAASLSGGNFAITGINTRPDTMGVFVLDEFRIAASPQAAMPSSLGGVYTAWATANGATGGVTADPDGDGLANLIEYALGGFPNDAASAPLPTPGTSGSFLTLTFTPQRSDVSYAVEGSDNLTTWPDTTTIPSIIPGTQVIFTDDVEITTATKRFLRLRVTQP